MEFAWENKGKDVIQGGTHSSIHEADVLGRNEDADVIALAQLVYNDRSPTFSVLSIGHGCRIDVSSFQELAGKVLSLPNWVY